MNANRPTVEAMTWIRYVDAIAAGETKAAIAAKIGITPPSVGRWYSQGSLPDPGTAATFARVYNRPVLEAFIAAGFLTSEEAGETPSAPPTLATLDDDELLEEVRRRMQGGSDAGDAEAEKRPPLRSLGEEFAQLDGVPELTRQDDVDLAARRVPGHGKIKEARDAAKRVGEETQDNGGMEPA